MAIDTTPPKAYQATGRVATAPLVERRDAALKGGPAVAVGLTVVPGPVAGRRVAIPLLDVVDGPAATTNRTPDPSARGDAPLIVRVVGHAVAA